MLAPPLKRFNGWESATPALLRAGSSWQRRGTEVRFLVQPRIWTFMNSPAALFWEFFSDDAAELLAEQDYLKATWLEVKLGG